MMADVLRDARYGVRQLAKTPGLRGRRDPHAGARHRRHQRDLQRRQRRAAAAAAVSGAGRAGARQRDRAAVRPLLGRARHLPRLARAEHVVRADRRVTRAARPASPAANGPERINSALVSWDLFELLRVHPVLGPGFTRGRRRARQEQRDRPQPRHVAAPVRRRPGVVGRTMTLSGAPATIIGVMPPGFAFPARAPSSGAPIALNPAKATRGGHFLGVVARLKPGVTRGAGRRRDEDDFRAAGGAVSRRERRRVRGGRAAPRTDGRRSAAGAADAARGGRRGRADRLRQRRQPAAGARVGARKGDRHPGGARRRHGAGWCCRCSPRASCSRSAAACSGCCSRTWPSVRADAQRRQHSAGRRTSRSTAPCCSSRLAMSLATGSSSASRRRGRRARPGIGAVLKEGGRSSATSAAAGCAMRLLVTEVALSIVLLVGAALLLRSFARVTTSIPDSAPTTCWRSGSRCRRRPIREDHQRVAFFDTLIGRLEHASAGSRRPAWSRRCRCAAATSCRSTSRAGRQPKPADEPSANHRVVSPGYFPALGIPLKRGRLFTEQDTETSPMVAVVDEAFAARHFPNEDPIGRGIDIGNGTDGFYQIVGVVGNVHHVGLEATRRADDVRAVQAGRVQHDVGRGAERPATRRSWPARRGRRFARSTRRCRPFR